MGRLIRLDPGIYAGWQRGQLPANSTCVVRGIRPRENTVVGVCVIIGVVRSEIRVSVSGEGTTNWSAGTDVDCVVGVGIITGISAVLCSAFSVRLVVVAVLWQCVASGRDD